MSVVVITPPSAIMTATEAKAWAPVLAADDDARVDALLLAAQAAIEPPNGWLGRAFGLQTLEARLDGFPLGEVRLPFPPLRSVASIVYRDEAGVEHTMAPDTWEATGVGTARGSIMIRAGQAWPATAWSAEAVRVRFEAGYAANDPQLLPAKHAVVLGATHLRSLTSRDLALSSRSVEGVGSRTWVVSDAAAKLVRATVEDLLMPFRVYA